MLQMHWKWYMKNLQFAFYDILYVIKELPVMDIFTIRRKYPPVGHSFVMRHHKK
jgi:hypothetical protein